MDAIGKTIVSINAINIGSTGNIMYLISSLAETNGFKTVQMYPLNIGVKNSRFLNDYIIEGKICHRIVEIAEKITGLHNCFNIYHTLKLIHKISKLNPAIIQLHNIHGSYINLYILFKYIKKNKIKVVWTLHDCWAFTGRCPHFSLINCAKWKTVCKKCKYPSNFYPCSFFDTSSYLFDIKKAAYEKGIQMTIVTPSKWLAELVKQSFLSSYKVIIINNGIDLSVFKPMKSDFRQRYNCANKIILLGVASSWDKRKGLDIFVELANKLESNFQIVLVGVKESLIKTLPKNIISISRTNTKKTLVEIYSAADIFINPTLEDNYPSVNMEALACGTPVITYNTGGSAEIIGTNCGYIIYTNTVSELLRIIRQNKSIKQTNSNFCVEYAKRFDQKLCYSKYIQLYFKLIKDGYS